MALLYLLDLATDIGKYCLIGSYEYSRSTILQETNDGHLFTYILR